MKKGN